MKSLATTYMGLKLKNPLILGSSSLSANIDGLKKAEDAGFGAVVLKSIFEEQIINNSAKDMMDAEDYITHAAAYSYLQGANTDYYVDQYFNLVYQAKQSLEIPVIASINCTSETSWLDYAKRFANCGADGVEINYYRIAGNAKVSGSDIEKGYINVAKKTRKSIDIPLAMKLPWHFSSISNMVKNFSDIGMDGIVLFNHFFRPDIDIENVKVCDDKAVQPQGDYSETLRWTAIMSSVVKADICSSTGIRDSSTVIKMLLAGAKATQISSAIYTSGYGLIKTILTDVENWMDRHNFETIDKFRGKLSYDKISDPQQWERAQFMKIHKF